MVAEFARAMYLNGREVVVLEALMVLQDWVFPLWALVFAILADCVTVVLQHMIYSVGVQMVLQSMVAYGPKVMVLEDMVVYGFLHLAGVVGG